MFLKVFLIKQTGPALSYLVNVIFSEQIHIQKYLEEILSLSKLSNTSVEVSLQHHGYCQVVKILSKSIQS